MYKEELLHIKYTIKIESFGQPWWLSGLAPPLAQGMILETWRVFWTGHRYFEIISI